MNLLDDNKAKIGAGVGIVVVFGALFIWGLMGRVGSGVEVYSERDSAAAVVREVASERVKVYVAGAVLSPGVYDLKGSDRVIDAVKLAGGLAEGADEAGVNLAGKLVDGMQVTVPWRGDAVVGGSGAVGLVSVNSGSVVELQGLPSVGPVLAAAIVRYREVHGPFRSVEDLARVPGLGAKTLDRIRDRLTL